MRQKQAHSIKRVFLQLMLSSNRVTLALPEGSRCLAILCFYMQPISNKGKRSAEHRTLKSLKEYLLSSFPYSSRDLLYRL